MFAGPDQAAEAGQSSTWSSTLNSEWSQTASVMQPCLMAPFQLLMTKILLNAEQGWGLGLKNWQVERDYSVSQEHSVRSHIALLQKEDYTFENSSWKNRGCTLKHTAWPAAADTLQPLLRCQAGSCKEFCPHETLLKLETTSKTRQKVGQGCSFFCDHIILEMSYSHFQNSYI